MRKDKGVKIKVLPILPIPRLVLFPKVSTEIIVYAKGIIEKINTLYSVKKKKTLIGIVMEERLGNFSQVGTVARIKNIKRHGSMQLPSKIVLYLEGLYRFRIIKIIKTIEKKLEPPYPEAEIEILFDQVDNPAEVQNWAEKVASVFQEFSQMFGFKGTGFLLTDAMKIGIKDPGYLADLIAYSSPLPIVSLQTKQEILETLNIEERLKKVFGILERLKLRMEVGRTIFKREESVLEEQIIREEIEELQKKIGKGREEEIQKHRERISKAQMPPEIEKGVLEELDKLSRIFRHDPEYSYIDSWLRLVEELPWSISTEDKLDIKEAEKVLEEDHYALEHVKKRILEFLAVRKMGGGKKAIFCFIGPPGTGKTSVGKSIARAMGRKFVRISLGGVYDEAQIRGHRRTYVGALPGVIINEIKKAGSKNPVFMIDEIDKIGTDRLHGDPSSALLETLDPEQNFAFTDHYLDLPFDLSEVMFICTGNFAESIQPALRDRMETIDFPGYTKEEKLQIAKKYLLPRQLEANGLTAEQLQIKDEVLNLIIRDYTRETGVRNLEREIGSACRHIATKIAMAEMPKGVIIQDKLSEILGPPKYISQLAERMSRPGVAVGLAWTPTGGEILFIEAEIVRGVEKTSLEVTGNVEKIMRESVQAALTYVEANLELLKIPVERSPKGCKIHIHVPEAATPKDGPSAGLAILTALVSLLRKQVVREYIALTGEITLRGKILPVGGIKEKILAAKEAGIKMVIIPKENEKDLEELPLSVKESINRGEIEIKLISEMKEALEIAIDKSKTSSEIEK